ncbi:MAG: FtsX-like permease family protein [Candidatus Marinimicrobia bacterium]|nr:FtsX-like permease family protein [Candidatus Neomarinimicrobiota bacterium]
MIKFLFKGLIRDKHRSLFPILSISIGVILTVIMQSWVTGILGDMIDFNAKFTTGHTKVVTRAYSENIQQMATDLAIIEIDKLTNNLENEFPKMTWIKRIRFGGLLDIPDENGETKSQGPVIGWGINLLSDNGSDIERMNIRKAMKSGEIPTKLGEILISDELAEKLKVKVGDDATLLGSTMFGSMAMQNFVIVGTVHFGTTAMDKGAIIVDFKDAQRALNMENATSEILGYFESGKYDNEKANQIVAQYNKKYSNPDDDFSPIMLTLGQQNDLNSMLEYMDSFVGIIIFVFIFAMSLVLWNIGLIGGLRRYGEIGLRLAIGESKGGVYRKMIYESVLVGICGSIFGTIIGLGISFYLQTNGIDLSSLMQNTSMMMPSVYRAKITPLTFYIGFIPGLLSTIIGTALAGIGIYKRQTAQLFRELDV